MESRADRRSGAEVDGSRGGWGPASLAERRGRLVGDDSLAVGTEPVSASDAGLPKRRRKASRAPSFRLWSSVSWSSRNKAIDTYHTQYDVLKPATRLSQPFFCAGEMTARCALTAAQDHALVRMVFIVGQAEHTINAIDVDVNLLARPETLQR